MPSLIHEFAAVVIPRVRRSGEVRDPERLRRAVIANPARQQTAPPARGMAGLALSEVEGFGFPVYDVRPAGATPTRTVIYLHGGGYVGNIDRFHWRYVARLVRNHGVRVVLPAYPLAPEHTWRDAHPPMQRLFEQTAIESPQGVTLMGDSAGGGLALAMAQRAAVRPGPLPTHLVLISPWVDLTHTTPGTDEASAGDPWLKMSWLDLYASWWAGEDDTSRPEVSPLFGDFERLPPTLVWCGTRDTFFPQDVELVRRMRTAGVDVTFHEGARLLHVYPILPIPEARRARRELAAFL